MAKLQIALDGDLSSAFSILADVHQFVDIVEIGTPLIFREGMHGVAKIREAYPNLKLLADLKIMDAGEEEATIAFKAGADFVTVLGGANDATIAGAVASAKRFNGNIVADMMQVSDLIGRSHQLIELGCDFLCLHTAYDVQANTDSPYRDLAHLRDKLPNAQLAIAGGVKADSLPDILPHRPDIIIVGGAITKAENPKNTAETIYTRIQSYEHRTIS